MVEQEATDTLEPLNLDESTVGRLLSMEEVIAAMDVHWPTSPAAR